MYGIVGRGGANTKVWYVGGLLRGLKYSSKGVVVSMDEKSTYRTSETEVSEGTGILLNLALVRFAPILFGHNKTSCFSYDRRNTVPVI